MNAVASLMFACALVQTFAAPWLLARFSRSKPRLARSKLLHYLTEVEAIFGFWALLLIVAWAIARGPVEAWRYLHQQSFSEAIFVFAIMTMAATRPVTRAARYLIISLARYLPVHRRCALYFTTLVVGPLLGSIMTEPAAMTVTATLIHDEFLKETSSRLFSYATLAALFVNVAVGGLLTHFAAPPVLVVAAAWSWRTPFMFMTFGWRAIVAVGLVSLLTTWRFRRSLALSPANEAKDQIQVSGSKVRGFSVPGRSTETLRGVVLTLLHFLFMGLAVMMSHGVWQLILIFAVFLLWNFRNLARRSELKIEQGALVGLFLAALVILGGPQKWWVQPLLQSLSEPALFWTALGLTSVVDNAAITYLGTLVVGLSEQHRYMLVAGAICGGGLTVIANAPNPIGYGILKQRFEGGSIRPLLIFAHAVPYTILVSIIFLL